MAFDYRRSSGNSDCGNYNTPYSRSLTVTWNGTEYYGTVPGISYDTGDTHTIRLVRLGAGIWQFQGSINGGCGLSSITATSVNGTPEGAYPTANGSGGTDCGCPEIVVEYANIVVS